MELSDQIGSFGAAQCAQPRTLGFSVEVDWEEAGAGVCSVAPGNSVSILFGF